MSWAYPQSAVKWTAMELNAILEINLVPIHFCIESAIASFCRSAALSGNVSSTLREEGPLYYAIPSTWHVTTKRKRTVRYSCFMCYDIIYDIINDIIYETQISFCVQNHVVLLALYPNNPKIPNQVELFYVKTDLNLNLCPTGAKGPGCRDSHKPINLSPSI
jgi:hypothetical protein